MHDEVHPSEAARALSAERVDPRSGTQCTDAIVRGRVPGPHPAVGMLTNGRGVAPVPLEQGPQVLVVIPAVLQKRSPEGGLTHRTRLAERAVATQILDR